jgi:uncharacterized protein (DUF1778 family)
MAGKLPARARRPAADAPRRHDVRVRLSAAEFDLLRDAAERDGLSLGAWLGRLAVQHASNVSAPPLPATVKELIAELVKLRVEVLDGTDVPIVEIGSPPKQPDPRLQRIDALTAAAINAARRRPRRRSPRTSA